MQKEIDHYLSQFESAQKEWKSSATGATGEPSWLNRCRLSAIEHFARRGFPIIGEEEWKYTNMAPLASIPFVLNGTGTAGGTVRLSPQDISTLIPGAYTNHLLVFVNGHYSSRLSRPGPIPEGVQLLSLSEVIEDNPPLLEPQLNRLIGDDANPFTALNTAFMEDGAVVILPMGAIVRSPIYLLFLATDTEKPRVTHPRNLIIAGENSQASIVEYYLGVPINSPQPPLKLRGGEGELCRSVYFTNAVTELIEGDYSVIEHIKIQEEARQSFHIASLKVHQGMLSRFVSNYVSLGAVLSRNNIHDLLDSEGAECTLNGLTIGAGCRHADSHTRIDHLKPRGTSNELYKAVLDDRSRGVFDGKIVVHKDAQKTSARQTNKNLLLSDQAEADPTPQLEIFADDVKVSHGSTVGQLDKNQVFYLRSRGIGEAEAKGILTSAFAGEMVEKITIPAIKNRVREVLSGRF